MFWFQFKLYLRTVAATWKTFGPGKILYVHAVWRPVARMLTGLMLALDHLLFPGFRRMEVRQPLFIVGHPRSGTTFLHRLFSQTREFCVFEMWEIFFPSLLERKIFGGLMRQLAARGKGILFPRQIGHEVGLRHVEEEEMLFFHNGNTQFMTCLTPLAFSDADFAELVYADDQPACVRRSTMAFLKGCFQRQIYASGKPQIVAKMNYSAMRVKSLLHAFPDAKVVYVVRSPLETIPSHLTLHRNMFDHLWGVRRIPANRLRQYYQRRYRHNVAFYRYLEELIQRGDLPPQRFMVVPYDGLRQDVVAAVRAISDFAGLSLSSELQAKIEEEGRKQACYTPEHVNSQLEEFGLTKERVVRDLAFIFDKYGFPR